MYVLNFVQGLHHQGPDLLGAGQQCRRARPGFNRNRLRRVPGPASGAQVRQPLDFVEKVPKPSKYQFQDNNHGYANY